MAKAEKRARARVEAMNEETSPTTLTPNSDPNEEEARKSTNDAARKIYRAGGEPKSTREKRRRVAVKPLKWRQGTN